MGRRFFGFVGTATDLGSERDQNFRLTDDRGHSAVLKVSNPADTREIVELQTLAAMHVARTDAELPVARPLPTLDGSLWGSVERHDGFSYFVRLFTFLDGSSVDASDLTGEQLRDLGTVIARVGRALRGFFHPAAGRMLQWDVKYAAELRTMLADIEGERRQKLVTWVIDWFETEAAPVLRQLRAQIVHGDLVLDNLLMADGHVSGIIDFGDVTHTPLVCDLAASLADVMRVASDPFALASPVIQGYRSITELENDEKMLLPVLVATRFATMVTISASRARRYPENAENITAWDSGSWRFLETLEDLGPVEAERRFRAILAIDDRTALQARHDAQSLERRRGVLGGSTLSPLSYTQPLYLVRGQGAWMFDGDGRAYLDAYNNVPVVGHCHPAVTEAIASQARTLNTNTRYLHEHIVELAERLTASMPEELDTCVLVNSGSEANDMAWRLATSFTGNGGGIVSQHAYHGITEATDALSPEVWAGSRPRHVATVPAPDGYRGPYPRREPEWATRFAQHVADAVSVLAERGMRSAATMMDSAFTSDGILPTPPEYLREVMRHTHEAGALFVADEVQTGFGRTGDFWGFEASGITPDIVTLGKPMGNGHPVAAVVTRSDIAQAFAKSGEFFSTFGGNPVACAAGLAVLEVLEREALPARAATVGAYLRQELNSLAQSHPWIGDVRGRGLLIGVELVHPNTREPAPSETDAVVNAMRERGVLIGATGPAGNVLKIRPPLVFSRGNADMLTTALGAALSAVHA